MEIDFSRTAAILFMAIAACFVLLLAIKLGTYGFYLGRQLFLDEQEKKGKK